MDCMTFGAAGDDNEKEEAYMVNCILGGRQYCVRDPLSTLPTARMMMRM